MSSNAIGTGALILSASADGMLSDLNKVEKQATKAAKDITDKVGKASGGGIFSKMLGGAVAGGAAGAVMGAVGIAADIAAKGVEYLVDAFEKLSETATGADKGALVGIRQSFEAIQGIGLKLAQKLFNSVAPAIMTIADAAVSLFDRAEPLIDVFAAGFETIGYIASEVMGAVLDLVGDGLEAFMGWAQSVAGFGSVADTVGKGVLEVFAFLARGAGYLWDSLKAGAGIMAAVGGVIVEGLSLILREVAKATKQLADLGNALPEELRPEWLGRAADATAEWLTSTAAVGREMQQWGAKAVGGFGETAEKWGGWIDGLGGKLAARKQQIAGLGTEADKVAEKTGKLQLSGANLMGSTGAYSIIAKSQAGSILNGDLPKQQLKVAQEQKQIMVDIKLALMKERAREIGAL